MSVIVSIVMFLFLLCVGSGFLLLCLAALLRFGMVKAAEIVFPRNGDKP